MKKRRISGFIIFLLLLLGCRNDNITEAIDVSGSTTVLPMISVAAEEFYKENPEKEVNVQGGGSSAGIEQVSSGIVDIGMASRELKGEENGLGLKTHAIAIDAVAIVINSKSEINGLNEEQVRDIFTGKIRNWKELGGDDEEIIVVNRDEASGTREAFKKIVIGEEDFIKEAVIQPGSGQVRSIVANTPGAVGYMSLGYVTEDVKALSYNGVVPSKENIINGTYKVQRKLYLLTKGEPDGLTKEFIDYVLSERIQEEIIGVEFIPINM